MTESIPPDSSLGALQRGLEAVQRCSLPELLVQRFPGAYIRTLHWQGGELHLGIEPGKQELVAVVEAILKAAVAHGVTVQVTHQPVSDCCGSGCEDCIVGPATPKRIRFALWGRRPPGT